MSPPTPSWPPPLRSTAVSSAASSHVGTPAGPADGSPAGKRPAGRDSALRETVESLVIAFVLAFLFRTFAAEAFVIPTGSMAPTLMGRHKDVVCPECGCPYQISASNEVSADTNKSRDIFVVAGTCPNCRYTMALGDDQGHGKPGSSSPSYNGDRILVGKFAYDYTDPRRWDVAVFKWPGGSEINYIKRVVGLPGETIKIRHGDIFVRPAGQSEFAIARKPPEKLEAVLQPVYDNDYVPSALIRQGWPTRWSPAPGASSTAGQWRTSDDLRTFHTNGSAPELTWLRYQHFVPSSEDWQNAVRGKFFSASSLRPQLVSDFTAYNTEVWVPHVSEKLGDWLGLHWVGDLAVEGVLDVESPQGQVVLELVKGGRRFRCQWDVASGQAQLSIQGLPDYHPVARTDLHGPGRYHVRFANADEQLVLWVNQSVVTFDQTTAYPTLGNNVPTRDDLEPVRIGSQGTALGLSHLRLRRDLYYIADRASARKVICDFPPESRAYQPMTARRVAQFLSDPEEWGAFQDRREVEFPLDEDQYLVLGDNSAQSSDCRLWSGFESYVSRELLIGRALYVYWPHSWDRLPGLQLWCPLFPNFARMRFIR